MAVRQSARFDFKLHVRWFSSADHVSSICTGRPTLIPQIFGYRAAIGGSVNRKERGRNDGGSRLDQLSDNVINQPAYHLDFNFSEPAIIIIPRYPRFYNCHGNSSVRSFIFPSLYRPSPRCSIRHVGLKLGELRGLTTLDFGEGLFASPRQLD